MNLTKPSHMLVCDCISIRISTALCSRWTWIWICACCVPFNNSTERCAHQQLKKCKNVKPIQLLKLRKEVVFYCFDVDSCHTFNTCFSWIFLICFHGSPLHMKSKEKHMFFMCFFFSKHMNNACCIFFSIFYR